MIFAAVSFSGCGSQSVEGNTYVFESVTVTGGTKEENELITETLSGQFEGIQISFGTDGSCSIGQAGNLIHGTYTQNGNKVTAEGTGSKIEFTVNGNNIEYKVDIYEGIVATIKFAKDEQTQKPETPEDTITSLAGKIFYVSDVKIEDMTGDLSQTEIDVLESQLYAMVEGAYLAFYDESNCTVSLGGNVMSGVYARSGNTITITVQNDDEEFIIGGNKITKSQEIVAGDVTGLYATMEYSLQENVGLPDIPLTTLAGKTYSFYTIEVVGLSGNFSPEVDEYLSGLNDMAQGTYFTFIDDTSCSFTIRDNTLNGVYSIEGSVLFITINGDTQQFILSADKLSQSQKDTVIDGNVEIKVIYSLDNN